MELLILKLVVLIRSLASIEDAAALFDVLGIGAFTFLLAAMFIGLALRKSLRLSVIDWLIVAITIWCIAVYLIYFEGARIRDVAKLVIPLLSFTLVKNIISDQREYRQLLIWMIVGLSIPTVISAVLVAVGSDKAIQYVSYWTSITRWQGVYGGSHPFGHSMTLLLMTIGVYFVLQRTDEHKTGESSRIFSNASLALLSIIAVYCLYMSQVRTAVVGLLIFVSISLYHYNRRILVFGATGLVVLAVLTSPLWVPTLTPEFAMRERGIEVDNMSLASGRPKFWLNDILIFAELPIDQKLAGTGIGNRDDLVVKGELMGHNDWLELLTQTGVIGLMLFVGLQIAIFSRIRRMPVKERGVFLALFLSVVVMMAASNSYVWRIQVSQLYYMMLAFIEIPRGRGEARLAEKVS